MLRRGVLLSLACLAALGAASARASTPLSLKEVLDSVRERFPGVVAAARDRDKAEGDLLADRGGFDPVLKGFAGGVIEGQYPNRVYDLSVEQGTPLWGTRLIGGWRSGRGSFPSYDGKLVTNADGEWRAGVEVPLLRNGALDDRRARIAASEAGLAAAGVSVEGQRLEALRAGAYRYWEWVAAGRKLAIAKELLQIAQTRDRGLAERVRTGDAARIEREDNQRAVLQRQGLIVAAERSLQKAGLELSLYLRQPEGAMLPVDPGRLPDSFPDPTAAVGQPDLAAALRRLSEHPELQRLRLLKDQADVSVRLSDNRLLPRLDAGLFYSQDLGSGSTGLATPELRGQILLEMPLLFREARGKLDSARASFLKLEIQESLQRDRLRNAVTDAAQALSAAVQRLDWARRELELARKLEASERIRVEHGDSDLFTVVLREQATADVASREVDALADLYRSIADFHAASGRWPE